MRAAFAIAALAGSAIAAPGYNYNRSKKEYKTHVVVETIVKTVYVTEGYPVPAATPSSKVVYSAPAAPTSVVNDDAAASSSAYVAPVVPSSAYVAPVASSIVYEAPVASSSVYVAPVVVTPTPTPTPVVTPTPTPTPEAAATTSAAAAPVSTSTGYMAIVDEYRTKMGLKALTQDATLESNVEKCLEANPGQMVHILNAGSYGQVLAPGTPEDFLKVFVGGWLCEIPTLPGLDGICTTMSEGWAYEGQTGHAEILTSDNYSKIGCRNFDGIWGCDLA